MKFDPFRTCNSIKNLNLFPLHKQYDFKYWAEFSWYLHLVEVKFLVLKETADSRARRIFEILDVNDDGRKNTPKRLLRPIKTFCI